MAKDFKDCKWEFERLLVFGMKNMVQDGLATGEEPREVDIAVMQILAHSVSMMAYVGSMSKEAFLEAMEASYDDAKELADETERKVNEAAKEYREALKDAMKQAGVDLPKDPEKPLKN